MNEQKQTQLKRVGKLLILWGVLHLTLLLAVYPMISAINEGMQQIIEQPAQKQETEQVSPRFRSIMQTAVTLVEICLWAYPVICLLTGVWILQTRHLTGCVVGAALVCVSVPLGTILGIWTLILLRDSDIRVLFEPQTFANKPGDA